MRGLLLISLLIFTFVSFAFGQSSIGETFVGEELHYEIDLWFIKGIAEVTIFFSRSQTKGRYIITLKGRTKSLAAFASIERSDEYIAIAEEIDGGRRLKTVYYEENVTLGKRKRQLMCTFDENRGEWLIKRIKDGSEVREYHLKVPKSSDHNDFLTAAYNFRYGVYGQIKEGSNYSIPILRRKEFTNYEITVLRPKNGRSALKDYHVLIKVDPDLVNSSSGYVEGWLSSGLYPVEGLIRDVFLFGDVRGRLIKRVKAN
ncbi:MAG: DUF3108 domain-containing protein [Desulfobacterota bacterium]|nr:DUF3108 domain-containing protein [Thermodesulfobacteriota bacterium]MDW8001689.1 DUF3108 domain-containing protein [Deltaproteobacteria bacterium]